MSNKTIEIYGLTINADEPEREAARLLLKSRYRVLRDREVVEVPMQEFLDWSADKHDQMIFGLQVGKDTVGTVFVSTVFIPMLVLPGDEQFRRLTSPFETMIFDKDNTAKVGLYETYDEAEAGHARVVAELRAVQENPDA